MASFGAFTLGWGGLKSAFAGYGLEEPQDQLMQYFLLKSQSAFAGYGLEDGSLLLWNS